VLGCSYQEKTEVLLFTSDSCIPCLKLKKMLPRYEKHFTFKEINLDTPEGEAVGMRANIYMTPTLYINGESIIGLKTQQEYDTWFRKVGREISN
jgi:glutaredoxin